MKYPVYVISKGRHDRCLTAKFLLEDGVDFMLVVEPQERELYSKVVSENRIITTPFSNLGLGSIPARNFVWDHSVSLGAKAHWILDDNIMGVMKRVGNEKHHCDSLKAFLYCEDFYDMYDDIGILGLNYDVFVPNGAAVKPFVVNCHVYSFMLIRNDIRARWRGRYNEDTDLCLQSDRYPDQLS